MSNDNQLQQAVMDELTWEPSVSQAHIGVTAKAGIVTLTGHVDSYSEKFAAEKAAGRVKGVKAVAEELEVRLPFAVQRGDEEIAAAALHRLSWDLSVPKDSVHVLVQKGRITLTGEVEWRFQKDAAQRSMRGLAGVVGISDQVTIRPQLDAADISSHIMTALHRSWLDPKTITVTAVGGKVHLTGTATSRRDRDLAESTAWAAPGAMAVQNNITIV